MADLFFLGKKKTKALPLAWWRLFRGYDMARPNAPKSTLSYAQVRYADGTARLEYGEAVERQGSGSRHACLLNKVSLLQCAPCRLDVDYVGVSARLQEVSAW